MNTDKNNNYIMKEFEENGMVYKSTELPFGEIFDFSSLEFPLPIKQSTERYTAQSIAKKTNTRMKKGKIEKSPTYPIMPEDLIWFAIVGYREGYPDFTFYSAEQEFGPYKVIGKEDDLKIHLLGNKPKNRKLDGLINSMTNEFKDIEKIVSANVRLFRHVDRNNPLDITYAFEKEPENESSETRATVIKPENYPEKPPLPEDHPKYANQDSEYSQDLNENPALEPIEKNNKATTSGSGEYTFENGEEIDLHTHIHEELKDNSITHLTKRASISKRNINENKENNQNEKGEQD
ncbi:hypothetical protein GF378_01030 [Candidatus Pacearchaeota archaeon]|nr:hypothetical protein [Candidatus Pacearchaeota archaeon]